MKELKEISIVLDEGRSSFCGGEIMRGQIVVDFEEPAEMWNMQVRFYGEGYSQVDNVHGSTSRKKHKKRESIVDLRRVLFGLKPDEIAERIPLHSYGRFAYDFDFMIPKYVPCSFESPKDREYGMAYIRYFIETTITRPWTKNISKEIGITVNQIIDTSLPEYSYRPGCQAEKEIGICLPDGRLYIEAYLDDICYNQSSNILITCRAENDSKRIMSSLYAKLFKRIRYRRKKETKTYLEVVTEYFGDRVLPKKNACWDNLEFKIPDVGPTITKSARVNVDYFVRVGMYQLYREEIHVDLPIVIGTTKAFLLEKRRREEELNQELSICVDLCEEREISEKGRQELQELAEMYKQMPFEGSRPPIQYISTEERIKRRNRLNTPRLEALDESGALIIGDEQSDLSRSSDLLHSKNQGLLSSELPGRRASESNLYAASNSKIQTGSENTRAKQREVKGYVDLWSRGSTPRANEIGRPSVRKAASHSSIDTRKIGSPISSDSGRKPSISTSRSLQKQQTGRKHVAQKKLDLKELATIAAGLSNASRKSSVNIKRIDGNLDGMSEGKKLKTSAEEDTTIQQSGDRQVERKEQTDSKKIIKAKKENVTENVDKESGLSSSGTTTKDKKTERVVSAKPSASVQRKTSTSRENKALKANGSVVPQRETNTRTLKNERLQKNKAKLSATNAFAKEGSKASLKRGNGVAKPGEKDLPAEKKKMAPLKTGESMISQKASINSKKSSVQAEKDVKKSKISLKNVSTLRKVSPSMATAEKNDMKVKNIKGTGDSDVNTREQIKDDDKKKDEDVENNNVNTNEIADEKTMADVNEKNFEGAEAFDKTVNEDGQNCVLEKALQDVPKQRNVNEEELKAIEQQTEENSPNIALAIEEGPISSKMSQEESKDKAEVSIAQGIDRNEDDSTFNDFDIEKEVNKASNWLISESGSNNEIARKRSLNVYEEDAIIPVAEEANLESSPFSFEDLESNFITENSSNGPDSKDTLIDELLIKSKETVGNLERVPSLDEFELFESQLLGEGETARKEQGSNDSNGYEGALKGQGIEGSGTTYDQTMEHITTLEDINNLGDSEIVGNSKKSAKMGAANSRSKVEDVNRDRADLNSKAALTTKTIRKTSISRQSARSKSSNAVPKAGTDRRLEDAGTRSKDSSFLSKKDLIEKARNEDSAASISNGYVNGRTNESEKSTKSDYNSKNVQPSMGNFQVSQPESALRGINVGVDMSGGDGASYNKGTSHHEGGMVYTMKARDADENENDVSEKSNAKITWQRTFTKIRTMESPERSRRRSILNIRVLDENCEAYDDESVT